MTNGPNFAPSTNSMSFYGIRSIRDTSGKMRNKYLSGPSLKTWGNQVRPFLNCCLSDALMPFIGDTVLRRTALSLCCDHLL